MAPPNRKGGGGLSARTLGIASAASLTAAMVTSRLFPPGTIYASALTPVIVAAVSEMLNRPVDRVTELRRQRRTIVMESRRLEAARVRGDEPSPLSGPPEFIPGPGPAADELRLNGNGNGDGDHPPIRIHGRRRSRVLHPKVWVATGLVAFVIAVAALTLPELIFGGAVATSHRTTFFGGGTSNSSTKTNTSTSSTSTQTATQTAPTTATQTTPTATSTTPTQTTPTTTGTTPAPSGGAPAPSGTSTSTSTTPTTPTP